jgi:hypothetical protein
MCREARERVLARRGSSRSFVASDETEPRAASSEAGGWPRGVWHPETFRWPVCGVPLDARVFQRA